MRSDVESGFDGCADAPFVPLLDCAGKRAAAALTIQAGVRRFLQRSALAKRARRSSDAAEGQDPYLCALLRPARPAAAFERRSPDETLDLSQSTALFLLDELVQFLVGEAPRFAHLSAITRARPRHGVDATEPLQAWFRGPADRWAASGARVSLHVDPVIHARRVRLIGILSHIDVCIEWGLNFFMDAAGDRVARRTEAMALGSGEGGLGRVEEGFDAVAASLRADIDMLNVRLRVQSRFLAPPGAARQLRQLRQLRLGARTPVAAAAAGVGHARRAEQKSSDATPAPAGGGPPKLAEAFPEVSAARTGTGPGQGIHGAPGTGPGQAAVRIVTPAAERRLTGRGAGPAGSPRRGPAGGAAGVAAGVARGGRRAPAGCAGSPSGGSPMMRRLARTTSRAAAPRREHTDGRRLLLCRRRLRGAIAPALASRVHPITLAPKSGVSLGAPQTSRTMNSPCLLQI
ncbi:unnamed protein product [Prorocentrum cordatum]|uniref:Uncharacterized protein n=1 Tax=Prorocentrum cordatum TaxID=2364126 RepID=A0ABN9TJ34_9DINO|nr:unnamed protein product [Polarella glacialis]